jgi:hypothetical protein
MVTRFPRPLGGLQDALPEEGRAGPAIALALEQLQTGDLPLHGAVTPTQREACGDHSQVLLLPAGEAGRRDVLGGGRGPAMRGWPEARPRVQEGRRTRRASGPAPPAADRQRVCQACRYARGCKSRRSIYRCL